MVSIHTPRLAIFWWALIAALSLCTSVAAAENKGVVSETFSDKYLPAHDSYLTPAGHPTLFSFSGRWHRLREVYRASVWPGTYVTLLTFGDYCTVAMKPRLAKPMYVQFAVSVNNGPAYMVGRMVTPEEVAKGPVLFRIDTPPPPEGSSAVNATEFINARRPNTVKLVSSRRSTPLSIVGVYVPPTLVRQNSAWIEYQQSIPYVEFVGGPAHNLRNFADASVEWQAAEALGYRHSHITTEDCFSISCSHPTLSFSQQYHLLNPVYRDPYRQTQLTRSGYFPFRLENELYQRSTPNVVIVNLGDKDLLEQLPPTAYADDLYEFLRFIRFQAHPGAYIFVMLKKDRYVDHTVDVVAHFADPRMQTIPFPKGNTSGAWERSLRKYVAPLFKDKPLRPHSVSRTERISGQISDIDITDKESIKQVAVIFLVLVLIISLAMLRDLFRVVMRATARRFGRVPKPQRGKYSQIYS
ncbi:uncharacterized protein V1518DRAFT_408138 [Limtongia smithiae]|uniref:uncharacterized protein n=1 Tax=Limtongia smithiae TaxID=1125753 RepID=UPI0034CD20DB